MKVFDDAYKKLNKEQKEAVDAIEGPVFVIAGPGTGKTQILTLRIANILRKIDTAPENILAITFTESGARNMRKRLQEIVGSSAYKVEIHTFHGFCNMIINRFPEFFSRIIGRVSIEEGEQLKIIESIIDNNSFELIKPHGEVHHYVYPILSSIKDLKREDVSVEEFKKFIEDRDREWQLSPQKIHEKGPHKGKMKGEYQLQRKSIDKNKELLFVYEEYEKELLKRRLFDYEDMLLEVVRELKKNPDLLMILQETYQYILADEHQDANRAQNELLELLSSFHDNPNLFLVGDEKQAIYRFQGASLENFHYFAKKYEQSKVIVLKSNYRSHQNLINISNELARGRLSPTDSFVNLVSESNEKSGEVRKLEFEEKSDELEFLISQINEEIKNGVPPEEIAILYRNNKDSDEIIDRLKRSKIPFIVHADNNILEDPEIMKFIILLHAINDLSNEHYLAKCLFLDFFDIPIDDVFRLTTFAKSNRILIGDLLKNRNKIEESGVSSAEKIENIYATLKDCARVAKNELLLESFERIARETGYIESLLKLPNSLDALNSLRVLFDFMQSVVEQKRDAKISDFMSQLEIVKSYNRGLSGRNTSSPLGYIRLMTVHRSKGLEFSKVFIPFLDEKHWGENKSRTKFDISVARSSKGEISDERRLFYVAITRGKNKVVLTYSLKDDAGNILIPSPFLDEIESLEKENIKSERSNSSKLPILNPKIGKEKSLFDKAFLKERFLDQGLAVTSLNNYIECPLKYFFVNLIQIPQEKTRDQLYGTAVHGALKETIDRLCKGEDVSKNSLLAVFERELSRLPLSMGDFEDSLKKGQASLGGYYDSRSHLWIPPMLTEVRVNAVPIGVGEDTVLLKGVFDRIDVLGEGKARVIDYKTSKPKTRNEIEGKTKNSTGNEKRQLIFYQLLMDAYFKDKFSMSEGVIDFVEPDLQGRFKSESFVISSEEVKDLEKVIKDICSEIIEFNFFDKGCSKKECEYCKLARLSI